MQHATAGPEHGLPAGGPERIDELNRRSAGLIFQNVRQALAFSEEALVLSCAAADRLRTATSALRLGNALSVSGDDDRALQSLQEALALFRQLGDHSGEAGTLLSLSTITRNLGHLIDGLQYAFEGLDLARRHGLTRPACACLSNVGLLYTDLGDYQKALEAFLEALPIARTIGSREDEAMCLTNLGDVCRGAGQPDKALAHYQAAMDIHHALADTHREIDTMCGMGQAHIQLGQAEQAQHFFTQALALAHTADDHKCDSRLLTGLGDAHVLQAQHDAALAAYQQAQHLAGQAHAAHEEVRVLRQMGALALAQQDVEAALNPLERAMTLSVTCQAQRDQQEVHALLSEAERQRGHFEQALSHYQAYHRLERELDNRQALHRTQALMLEVDIQQARQAAEVQRQINAQLTQVNEQLAAANLQKADLLERLQEQAQHLARLSQEDALTGLFNRRHFNEQLDAEVQRAARYGRPLSVVLLDIDHFKAVNDTYSHQMGDLVLRELADLLRAGCRHTDTVARFGGEEFVLLLPETSRAEALVVCERLRRRVQDHPWADIQPGLGVTISLGIGADSRQTASGLLGLADAQLYQAKRSGRNRVCGGAAP